MHDSPGTDGCGVSQAEAVGHQPADVPLADLAESLRVGHTYPSSWKKEIS
jgi:hypothetical protein